MLTDCHGAECGAGGEGEDARHEAAGGLGAFRSRACLPRDRLSAGVPGGCAGVAGPPPPAAQRHLLALPGPQRISQGQPACSKASLLKQCWKS